MLVIQHVHKASEGQSREFQLEMRDELRWEMWAEAGTWKFAAWNDKGNWGLLRSMGT